MLFNSVAFLAGFLPLALVGYQIAGMVHRKAVVAWLGLVSLGFYMYWRPAFLIVLAASIAMNYVAAGLISRRIPNRVAPRFWMWLAICLNLGLLGYFKYLFPLLNFVSGVSGSAKHWMNVALPLGISFFTFTQIAFLVDLEQGAARQQDLSSYVLFVTFFPHLIAGPILHHKEMMPQFQQERRYRLRLDDLAVGFSWFVMGLGKKVMLADQFAPSADAAFHTPGQLSAHTAWIGALAYALQLYFDFSGYSDMALGLARMFSIDFPLNFNSPYKARSIIDFWQRWHMTLSQYIATYLFSPLQFWIRAGRRSSGKPVNREAMTRPGGFAAMIAFPTLSTMFVAGIWHGAGLQFLIFGILHGVFLTINHAWNLFRQRKPAPVHGRLRQSLQHGASVLLTFACVMVTFIFFRAGSTREALMLLHAMVQVHAHDASSVALPGPVPLLFAEIALGFMIVWFLPNTQQILSNFKPSLQAREVEQQPAPWSLRWSPGVAWAIVLGSLFFFSLSKLEDPSTFLYFQF